MSDPGPPPSQQGFTLLEMLVVLGIIALLAALAFPAVEKGIARAEFRAAANAVELAVRGARALAIGTGRTVLVVIPVDGESVLRAGPGKFRIPRTMKLQLPEKGLHFFADGSSTGGTVKLTAGNQFVALRTSADTGRIEQIK